MKVILALAALAALVASANATCYCKYLSNWSGDYCNPAVATSPNLVSGYTYTKDTVISSGGQIGSCDFYGQTAPEPSMAALANKCTSGCKAFAISYSGSSLKVCYYSTKTTASSPLPDDRCMGTWVKDDPPVVTPGCDCSKYGIGTGAYDKCVDCKRTTTAGDLCCSCPKTTGLDPSGCIDCVVTANPADRAACAPCSDYYADGTNGLTRCWECVKLAKNADAYAMSTLSASERDTYVSDVNGNPPKKWEMCHRFCRMLKDGVLAPRFPNMNDPTQCLDCVKDWGAATFVQVPGNDNGQCPSAGRRLAAL